MVDRLVNSEANTRRIAMVENCFGSSGVQLALPGRVLVGEGVLTKMCRKGPKSRQFFLFNDILVYGNIVLGKKKYNKQHIMPLEEVSLESLEDNGSYRNGWLIRTTTKSFVVYAATSTEKQEWMAHINKCVEDLLRKSGKKPVENHAAVWVPDAQASVCMHCKKTQFTMLVRRHHCRSCGAVVCGPCSSKKFLLPQQSSKPQRVCTACYEQLTKKAAEKGGGKSGGDHQVGGGTTVGGGGASKLAASAADSSGDDDSDDGGPDADTHDEPRFYGHATTLSADDSTASTLSADATFGSTTATASTTNNNNNTNNSNNNN